MVKIHNLLEKRLETPKHKKMQELSLQTQRGERSAFSGFLGNHRLSDEESLWLKNLLDSAEITKGSSDRDFAHFKELTEEARAIQMQSILLHGERIEKARFLFTNYEQRAFSSWLIFIYGNRQTPYNFLNYYLFHKELPQEYKELFNTLPRKAAYILSSRPGEQKKKEEMLFLWKGENKNLFIELIRKQFPLKEQDSRKNKKILPILKHLKEVCYLLESPLDLTKTEKNAILEQLEKLIYLKDRI